MAFKPADLRSMEAGVLLTCHALAIAQPSAGAVRPATAALLPAVSTATREPSIPYTVKPKDTLILLSNQLLEKPAAWPQVARFNRLKNPNVLSPGQILNIPLRLMKAQPVSGKIVSVFGGVQLAGLNGAAKAEVGSPVPEGSKLRTGDKSSAVIELADGSRITMPPGTQTELVTSRGYATRNAGVSGSTTWFSGLMRLAQGALERLRPRESIAPGRCRCKPRPRSRAFTERSSGRPTTTRPPKFCGLRCPKALPGQTTPHKKVHRAGRGTGRRARPDARGGAGRQFAEGTRLVGNTRRYFGTTGAVADALAGRRRQFQSADSG